MMFPVGISRQIYALDIRPRGVGRGYRRGGARGRARVLRQLIEVPLLWRGVGEAEMGDGFHDDSARG